MQEASEHWLSQMAFIFFGFILKRKSRPPL
jgi:hypothetical protein